MSRPQNNQSTILTNVVHKLPLTPGCYLFKDSDGQILYVGKSKSLRKRVASYFTQQKDEKIARLMRFVTDISYQCTATDIEALLLEYRLIKTYRPPYNIRMRKDRQYWYIKIDTCQTYPGLYVIEIPESAHEVEELRIGAFYRQEHAIYALEVISEYWRTPTCEFGNKRNVVKAKSPCLRFHIQRCLAPCARCTPANEYQSVVKEVISFFHVSHEPVLQDIKKLIHEFSQTMAYEKAAHLQNQYNSLYTLARHLENSPPKLEGKKYYVLLKSYHENSFLLAYIYDKCVTAWMRFADLTEWEIKSSAIVQYVENGNMPEVSLLDDFAIFSEDEGLRISEAVLEVEASRRFIVATNTLCEAINGVVS